jgi:threonine dehydratase
MAGAEGVTFDDVIAAGQRICGQVVRTPSSPARTLSVITGADVFVKFENLQFTASYKERGALNRLLLLPGATAGVVTASAGNFAQGVAHHAGRLGIPAVVVMPTSTPALKVSRTGVLGAEVVLQGNDFDEASEIARRMAIERGLQLLSPFDDADVIAGQGTVALELLADVAELDVLVVPVGGGGLLAGTALAARTMQPSIEIVGVQTERYPAVHHVVHDLGRRVPAPGGGSTIADGIAVAQPGDRPTRIITELVDRVEVVPESRIEEAIALYLEIEKTVAEGAGAISLAELLTRPEHYRGRRVGVVLSGGNIDLRQLASVTLRSLVRTGRLTRFWVEVDDRPGSLGLVTTDVGDLGGNIIEVIHQRLDPTVHARATEVELTIETADRAHLDVVLAGLRHRGHRVRTTEQEQRT